MSDTLPLYPRLLQTRIIEAMADTPVVLVTGPRQAGKTTLVRQFAEQGMQYLTLDDELTLLAAREDPAGLMRNLKRAVIDEIQRAPQLLLALKKTVDDDRHPGRFLLTGSANLMTLPTVTDSLAGRMETLTLLPLSQSEMCGDKSNWVDNAYGGRLLSVSRPILGNELMETVLRGGYPEAVARTTERRKNAWAKQYIEALVVRDVRDVAGIHKIDQLPRFLQALALVAGQMCNYSKLGSEVGLDHKTAARYVGIFEQMYLLRRVDVWARNRLKRIIKTPKLHFIDSGLLSALAGISFSRLQQNRSLWGSLLESFVFGELLKHITTAETACQLLYYRDHEQVEVDFVIENTAGQLIGIEVKAAATITSSDLRGLKRLADTAGELFSLGVILYDGKETMPLGDRLWAAPISCLWGN